MADRSVPAVSTLTATAIVVADMIGVGDASRPAAIPAADIRARMLANQNWLVTTGVKPALT